MANTHESSHADLHQFPVWSLVAYVVLISLAVDAALLASVIAHLTWVFAAIWAGSAALVSGGVLFTIFEMAKARDRS